MLLKNILKKVIILEREDKIDNMHFNMQLRILKINLFAICINFTSSKISDENQY